MMCLLLYVNDTALYISIFNCSAVLQLFTIYCSVELLPHVIHNKYCGPHLRIQTCTNNCAITMISLKSHEHLDLAPILLQCPLAQGSMRSDINQSTSEDINPHPSISSAYWPRGSMISSSGMSPSTSRRSTVSLSPPSNSNNAYRRPRGAGTR